MKLEDLKEEIMNKINNNRNKIEKLKEIKVKTKKDGSDFVNLSKAIEGGRVNKSPSGEYYIQIVYQGSGWNTCIIPCCGYVRDLNDGDKRKPRYYSYSDMYKLNSNEIKERITNEIESTENEIRELNEFYNDVDDIYNSFVEKGFELHDRLEQIKYYSYELLTTLKTSIEFGWV